MDNQEKYDDLYNLVQNLEMTVNETELKDYKEDISQILYKAQDDLKEAEQELAKEQEAEWKRLEQEQNRDYRAMVGF